MQKKPRRRSGIAAALLVTAAATVFFSAALEAAPPPGGTASLTRAQAKRLVQAFFRSYGVQSPGLNANDLGGAVVGEGQVYFEYRPQRRALWCGALIYRFRDLPRPGVLDAFRTEGKTTDAGGGRLEYDPKGRGLYLSRVYTRTVPEARFRADIQRLIQASGVWSKAVLPRAADRAFGHTTPGGSAARTPAPGSADEGAILDAVRRSRDDLRAAGANLGFQVDHLKIRGEWAYIDAKPLPRGSANGPTYAYLSALLRKEQGRWRAVHVVDPVADPAKAREAVRKRFPTAPADIFPPL